MITLTLQREDGEALPPWEPGAHIELELTEGLTRQYSLCGDPGDQSSWKVAILREEAGRGGSKFVHDHLMRGSRVRVRGPRNHFRLEPAARYLFIAGGIGITPLLPMLSTASSSGAQWHLVYGGRQRQCMAFADQLLSEHEARVTLHPRDTHGDIDLESALGEHAGLDEHTLVYCCGPEPLLDAVERLCIPSGLDRLRIERFRAPELQDQQTDEPFEVKIESTGEVLAVAPGESILDVLRQKGYPADASCEEGTCGTCETGVLEGEIDHRDSVLTASERREGELMMICVSRAACTRLVLDL
ncbi:PDR/VanB family oxidoreductase [Rhodococcus sp. NPDC003348]